MDTNVTIVPGAEVSRAATMARVLEDQITARRELLAVAQQLRDLRKNDSAEFNALYEFVEATAVYLEAELALVIH